MQVVTIDLRQVLDLEKSRQLLESYCEAVNVSAAIIDLAGEVLIGVRWQPICTRFHRVDERTCRRCIESDTELAGEM
ncbi:ATPase, partial [bacterium CPR1]|nr:ATPase [bacterium CPR1]